MRVLSPPLIYCMDWTGHHRQLTDVLRGTMMSVRVPLQGKHFLGTSRCQLRLGFEE